ncbi:hypothetical protein I302_106705 [Kwoniella bestiolae CBS 10118]|uniref:Urease accessory protein n=1 Tax=Kwoniella bestiolae CBS 10118 TaxID=1296100 RepID=A0A1B9G0M6_9TREE|nr:urease accessory protein [Kwoniella bestiolae CBS 10118]OCF24572.1 urease accessory protein [Kwoniella bestiolae CBS 10118]
MSRSIQHDPSSPVTLNPGPNHISKPNPRPTPKISSGSGTFVISSASPSSSSQTRTQNGHLESTSTSHKARFSTLSAAYPLKLLTPSPLPSQPSNLSILYTLAYGGGLVSGDLISLRGEVGRGCGLVMLTQGSTKVYKRRPGIRPRSFGPPPGSENGTGNGHGNEGGITRQRLHITLQPHSFLLLLPDSISPFSHSKYRQNQRFVLPEDKTASIMVLDWVNSGRGMQKTEKEIWSMDQYDSINEIIVGEELVMRERMVLDNPNVDGTSTPNAEGLSNIAKSLAPYHVYSTILFLGPKFTNLTGLLKSKSARTRQYQLKSPEGLIWSFSEVDTGYNAGVVRIASVEIEQTRGWLRDVLEGAGVREMVGEGVWPRCL